MSDLQCAATLLIVPHGEAEPELAMDSDDADLSPEGREQAQRLADSLVHARVAGIYCTEATARAVHTAEIAAARLGLEVRLLATSLAAAGEPGHQSVDRVTEELDTLVDLHRGETVLVVGSAEVIETVLPRLCRDLPADHFTARRLGPCDVVQVLADADGGQLGAWAG